VLNRKSGPVLVYVFLFISDIYLVLIIVTYLQNGFNSDPTINSRLGCKIFSYFDYALSEISPWLLVYISIEKFISISYSSRRKIMRSMKNQILFFICLSMVIFIGNIDEAFFNDIVVYDSSNEKFLRCATINSEFQDISSIVFFVIQALLPFILMIVFSSLLILNIFKSRIQITNNKRLKKGTKFAVSSLSMNVLFAILNFPNSVALYFNIIFISLLFVLFKLWLQFLCFYW
jgi:hypothetical protein